MHHITLATLSAMLATILLSATPSDGFLLSAAGGILGAFHYRKGSKHCRSLTSTQCTRAAQCTLTEEHGCQFHYFQGRRQARVYCESITEGTVCGEAGMCRWRSRGKGACRLNELGFMRHVDSAPVDGYLKEEEEEDARASRALAPGSTMDERVQQALSSRASGVQQQQQHRHQQHVDGHYDNEPLYESDYMSGPVPQYEGGSPAFTTPLDVPFAPYEAPYFAAGRFSSEHAQPAVATPSHAARPRTMYANDSESVETTTSSHQEEDDAMSMWNGHYRTRSSPDAWATTHYPAYVY